MSRFLLSVWKFQQIARFNSTLMLYSFIEACLRPNINQHEQTDKKSPTNSLNYLPSWHFQHICGWISPVATTGLWFSKPLKQSFKPPKLKYESVEFLSNLNVKPPYWRLSGDGSGLNTNHFRSDTLSQDESCKEIVINEQDKGKFQ